MTQKIATALVECHGRGLGASEAAAEAGISVRTLRRWLNHGPEPEAGSRLADVRERCARWRSAYEYMRAAH